MAGPVQADVVRREILGLIKKSEETVSEASRRLTEALRDFVPGDGSKLRTVVSEAFDYMERSLHSQRDFANSVLDAVLRDMPEKAKPAPKPAVKSRTAAKRPGTAKRPSPVKRPMGAQSSPSVATG